MCSSRAIATRRRRHTVSKNFFVLLLMLLLCRILRHRGCARRLKKFQRSRAPREAKFAEEDIQVAHNQAFTNLNSPPPSTPLPPLGALPLPPTRPAPLAQVPPAHRRRAARRWPAAGPRAGPPPVRTGGAPAPPQLLRQRISKVHFTEKGFT